MEAAVKQDESDAQGWVRGARKALTASGEMQTSVPLDALASGYVLPWDISAALDLYVDALGSDKYSSTDFMLALVVSLTDSDGLDQRIPSWPALDVHEMLPPHLYLFNRRFFAEFNDFEEYRSPIEDVPIVHHDGIVRAHYSCFRGPAARENDWEYGRAVWLEHYRS